MEQNNKIVLFQEQKIRREWHNNDWYFAIIDVIQTLTESENPRRYWSDLKIKLKKEGANQLYEKIVQLKIQSADGKKYATDCTDTEGVLRVDEYAILTAQIAKATFGVTPSEHKALKGLDKQNLRDHMTPLELIFTALSEEVTRTIAVQENAEGFNENLEAAQQGGALAGKARRNVEEDKRVKVVSKQNYLKQIKDAEKQNTLPDENLRE